MSVVITLEVEAKDGSINELKKMFNETLPDTRAYDGCEYVIAYTDQDKPNSVFLIEGWTSREHYEKYITWRKESGALEMLGALVAGPPTIRFFDAFDG